MDNNQKKIEKLARLQRKKELIEEVRSKIQELKFEESERLYFKQTCLVKTTSFEWALSVLKVQKNVEFDEIKKSYLQLAQQYHPDKNQGKDLQEMKDINTAWDIVKTAYR